MSIEVIAREDELAVVDRFLDRPADGLRALVIEGEVGIGKSTLWFTGLEAARARSFKVLSSRPAESERTLPNVVLGDLFGAVPAEIQDTLPPPRRRAFESAILLGDMPDVPVDPRALGVAILTLLPVLGQGRPLLLAIDDDQWMDPSSTATLLFALRRLRGEPLSLLLSRRSADTPTAGLDDAVDPGSVERVTVGPLSLGGVQLLLRRRLGIGFPRPTLARLHEVSGGNPFYALELARVQSMDPTRDANLPLAVPSSLEGLVGERIRSLDAPTLHAMLLIAAYGRFPVNLIGAVGILPVALDRARAASVIEIADGIVRFTHPLLASMLYHGAGGEQRREAHRLLATAVEDPVHRGRHLALAADGPSGDLAAALETAAGIALDRGMPVVAAELGEHALSLTPHDAVSDRHRRALAMARAHAAAGEGGRARAIAAELVAAAPRGRGRVEALVLLAEVESPATAVSLLGDALVEAAGLPGLEAAIHAGLADAGFFSSTKGRAWGERHARASLRIAERLDDDSLRANALSILAFLRFCGRDPHALELAERAHGLAEKLGDRRQLQRAAWSVGLLLTWSGRADAARDWLERRLADWSDHNERVRSDLLWYLSLVEMWSGRWSIAGSYADQIIEIGAHYGDHPYDSFPSAVVALYRGQFAVAREHSRRALAHGEGLQLEFFFGVLGMCDLWSGGPPAAALVNFLRAEQAADVLGEDEPGMRFWRAEYVEALLQAGHVDAAERVTADWEWSAQRLGRDRILALTVRCRGLIAAARGDLPTALVRLEEAVSGHDGAGDAFELARTLLALGMIRRRMRQKRSARAAMDAALAGFESLGAESWAATARSELARIGGRTRIEGLSPSEMSVAALVVEGRTNHEIAAALFLGERTVASHLTHIYAKLGIRSRTELSRHLTPHADSSAGGPSNIQTS